MKVKKVIKLLEEDGWYLTRQKGSHRQFKHPNKKGTTTVPGNLSSEMKPGTLNSISKQSQIKFS